MLRTATRNKKTGKTKLPILVFGAAALSILAFAFRDNIRSSFNPISIVANVTAAELKETDGRTNILILGSDKRATGVGADSAVLTDTILVASIGKVDKDVVLISIPRDLWVKSPKGNMKVNAVYAGNGVDALKNVLEEVLGIPLHYHALINFELFQKAIDTLGGVEVTVDNTFTDREYPVENMEKNTCGRTAEEISAMEKEGRSILYMFPCRYQTVQFTEGTQTMNGDTALKFVRSRKGDNNEGTDFARSKRQQKVIAAIKDKAFSLQTLINPGKLKELYDLYSNNIDSDVDFGTVQNFYLLSQQISFDRVVSIVLDDRSDANEGGLLYSPQDKKLYDGAYVLIPKTGDYSQIHAFVQRYIFGNK